MLIKKASRKLHLHEIAVRFTAWTTRAIGARKAPLSHKAIVKLRAEKGNRAFKVIDSYGNRLQNVRRQGTSGYYIQALNAIHSPDARPI